MEVAVQPSPPAELFEPFSYPGVPGAKAALRAIWPVFAEEALRLFLEGHRTRLERAAAPLASWLRANNERLTLEESWHPSIGLIARPTAMTKQPVALAAGFALHLAASGRNGEWAAEVELGAPLRVRNLLTHAGGVSARDTAGGTEIAFVDGEAEACSLLLDDGARAGSLPARGSLRSAGAYVTSPIRVLVTTGAVPGDVYFVDDADPFAPDELAAFAHDIQESLDFVAEFAPEFLDWIETAAPVVVPCHAPDEMLRSGSSNTLPGVVRVTASRRPAATAEMLIHEATHQYLHVALRVAPVDDGTDESTYYSPPKQAYRPLDKILTAYHAFANVERFYDSARSNGWQPAPGELELLERLTGELDVLEEPLRASSSLTTAGRALVDPLVSSRRR